jgi:hypothetical protein
MCYHRYSKAVRQRMRELQQQLAERTQAVTLLAVNAYCSGGVTVSAMTSSTSSDQKQQQQRSATATAQQHVVRVQLVHASAGHEGHQVYTIDTTLLAALHTQRGETGVSVLANMLVAPSSWSSAAVTAGDTTTAANTIRDCSMMMM